ncbi:MAG: gamma-glutamylcyclotransferase family protein, partial [Cyanobacteria bacterium P01_A01_bin.105]
RYLVDVVAAITPGLLYHFPQLGYPGMTMGNGWVHGYLLSFSSEAVLTGLDWLEDYDPQATLDKNEYRRQPTPVFTPDRHPLGTAWIYLMTAERVQALQGMPVPDGNWQDGP